MLPFAYRSTILFFNLFPGLESFSTCLLILPNMVIGHQPGKRWLWVASQMKGFGDQAHLTSPFFSKFVCFLKFSQKGSNFLKIYHNPVFPSMFSTFLKFSQMFFLKSSSSKVLKIILSAERRTFEKILKFSNSQSFSNFLRFSQVSQSPASPVFWFLLV